MEETLYEKIYNRIVSDIQNGKLQPGDRIPSENDLANEYNVSRITTKKAMELLAQSGYIERIRGRGSFVIGAEANSAETDSELSRNSPREKHGSELKLIGLLIPDMTDSFGLRLFRAIEERCTDLGCHLLVKLTNDRREVEKAAIRDFVKFGVDGLIVFPVHGEHYNGELLRLMLDDFPIVLVDRYFKGVAACSIGTDNKQAAQELTAYLLDKGHTEIAFISTPAENTTTIEDRIQGYMTAFINNGLVMHPEHVVTNMQSTLPQSSSKENIWNDRQVLGAFIENNPGIKAFVACEYNLALILNEELKQRRAGSDFEIVCFDSPEEAWGSTLFTAVRQDEELIGYGAVDLLHAQWNGEAYAFHNTVEYKLVYK